MSQAHYFAVPVLDQWLLYAPLHEVTALVNSSALERLSQSPSLNPDEPVAELAGAMAADCIQLPKPKAGFFDPEFLAIIATRSCNLDCRYCDFGGPTAARSDLDPALAVAVIDWMAERLAARGNDRFPVHLFGGEPMIAEDLVDVVVHRTRAVCARHGLRPHLEISTNGVFSERRAAWLGDYFDSVVLSFDGPPEFQDRNRPAKGGRPTFAAVSRSALVLSESPAELCLRVCVTGESLRRMPAIMKWMSETYRPAVITFEPLTENDLSATAQLPSVDPFEFVRQWITSRREAAAHGVELVYSAIDSKFPRLSACPVGRDALILTPDGTINACYLRPTDWLRHGMDLHLGHVASGTGVQVDPVQVEKVRRGILDKPRCRACFCRWSCAGGCHVNNTYPGCGAAYSNYCLQTRLITACLLIEELGKIDMVHALLADTAAMQRLATQPSDTFEIAAASKPSPLAIQ
jgi:uncharacterized protein